MSSVYIIGNCHLNGLMRSVQFFDPALLVEGCSILDLDRTFQSEDQCLAHLDGFTHVFTMPFDQPVCRVINSEAIARQLPHVTIYPTVTFGAFHPDVVYIFSNVTLGAVLPSPLGPYQSALALYGYRRGYDVARTVGLFRMEVFERLGYLGAWDVAVEALLQEPGALAFGFDRMVLSWVRHGCFMHTPQHPKVAVVSDIGRVMMAKAGYTPKRKNPGPYLPDDLIGSQVWPVYPEIASFYGLDGEYAFKTDSKESRWPGYMTLPEFVAGSYAGFAQHDLGQYQCKRVDLWLAEGLEL